jgi:tRNA threonylcarbamoyladenosine biosynthesis protein TsaB
MQLYIDTSDDTIMALNDDNGKIIDQYRDSLRFSQSEKLLQVIDELLKKNNFSKKSIDKIVVNCGPGSYTGIRVGITTANFLAFGLNIPVVCAGDVDENDNFKRPVSARYLKEPFITKEKSRLK